MKEEPCGECLLLDGERCDICGAVAGARAMPPLPRRRDLDNHHREQIVEYRRLVVELEARIAELEKELDTAHDLLAEQRERT